MEVESSARRNPFSMRVVESSERNGVGVASGMAPAPGHAR